MASMKPDLLDFEPGCMDCGSFLHNLPLYYHDLPVELSNLLNPTPGRVKYILDTYTFSTITR